MGHNKSSFLKQAVEHIDITSFDARPIIDSMSKCHLYLEKQPMPLKYLIIC